MRLMLPVLLPAALALPALAPALAQEKAQAPGLAVVLPEPGEKSASATVEATIEGVPSRASVRFSTPDSLRFDVEADATSGSPARSGEASGQAASAQTLVVEGRRARRLRFNGLSQWFRGGSEPLLQALGPWLCPTRELEAFYTLAIGRQGQSTTIEATANARGKYLRREQVRSGGAGGQRFYAARGVAAWNRPARIRLSVQLGHIMRREDFASATSTRPLQTWSWRYENNRPTLIEARDGAGALRARWRLSFGEPPAQPAALQAALQAGPEAIIEGDAAEGDQSAQQFASGARAARSESYAQAVAALSRAGELKPRSPSVALALFEIALSTRNNALAQAALLKIAALEGEASPRTVLARARLALHKGGAGAEAAQALDALAQAQVLGDAPNAALRLQAADLLRAGGRRDQAAALLLPLLDEKVPASIAAPAVARLDEWFSPLEQPARDALAVKIVGAHLSAQVARTLLGNQEAKALDASASPELEFLLARQAALAGRDDEADKRWKGLEMSTTGPGSANENNVAEALWLRSMLSGAQLAARRNDTASAILSHQFAWPMLRSEAAREAWLRALLSSWVKENRVGALRKALRDSGLRPLSKATGKASADALDSAEADARLLVAAEEAEGEADAMTTLRAQAARWKAVGGARAAWWQGHLAEALAQSAAQAASQAGTAQQRERLYDEAARAVDAAIALEPEQPFYAEQKLLLAARRVSGQSAVTDAASGVRDREGAQAALDSLRASFPSNTDALIASGLALLTMKQERAAVPLLKSALLQLDAPPQAQSEEAPGDEAGERVARITARSSLAAAMRKAGQPEAAMRLYAVLFEGARSPVEQGAFAANWLNALFEAREAAGGAAILSQVARTGWKPSQTQEVLGQVLASVSVRAGWRAAIRQSLEEALQNPGGAAPALVEGSALVAAYLDFSALNSARRAAQPAAAPAAPGATDSAATGAGAAAGAGEAGANGPAQQGLSAAIAVWRLDVARLSRLADSAEPGVAGQALSLLAQDALLRGQAAEAARCFERALERVPSDEGLALSLSSTLQPPAPLADAAGGAPQIAAEDAARIVRARDALLLRGQHNAGLLQQAARMSLDAGRAADARTLLARARALAFFDDSVGAGDYDDLGAPLADGAK